MAKEIVNPDPIPISNIDNINNTNFGYATFIDYNLESSCESSKELITYLENEYISTNYGNTLRSFLAENKSMTDVIEDIATNVSLIKRRDIEKHVMLFEDSINKNNTIVMVSVY